MPPKSSQKMTNSNVIGGLADAQKCSLPEIESYAEPLKPCDGDVLRDPENSCDHETSNM
jgi:hypothetical protein